MLNAAVIVAALGYFVDVYDLILFGVVRSVSVLEVGVKPDEMLTLGMYPFHSQMIGMLLGGVLWGIFGDKKGRLKVLFGSILMYSLANLANAFVQDIWTYTALRFIAGIGLAGELGAGITLVSEILPKNKRGYGTTIVATVGVLGAIFASLSAQFFDWRTCYIIGGVAGLALLVLRVSVSESKVYKQTHQKSHIKRGDLKMLFGDRKRFARYIQCIFVGAPVWYALGIFMILAPEFGKVAGLVDADGKSLVTSPKAIFYAYIGLTIGDLMSGVLSQIFKSRKKSLSFFIMTTAISCAYFVYRLPTMESPETLYSILIAIGFGAGYWAVFITTSAEQFGTNLRATVATSVPNFVRGMASPITWGFRELIPVTGSYSGAAIAVGVIVIGLSLASLYKLKESFHTDLDFVEG